jgi:hypothetical protein
MSPALKKWSKFALRWGIAIAGIVIVLSNISLHDRVLALGLNENNIPIEVKLRESAGRVTPNTIFRGIDPASGAERDLPRSQLVNRPDRKAVTLVDGATVRLLAIDLTDDVRNAAVKRLLVVDANTGAGIWIEPAAVQGGFELKVPNPLVDRGVNTMLAQADKRYLWLAICIFPVVFVLTAFRWQRLLKAIEVQLPFRRIFALNMVGCFYNSFMPGSTGGDVLKAWYIAKQTHHRTRAVMSVIIDRIIGLLALVMLGGAMASFQWATAVDRDDAATRKCMQVALGSIAIIVVVVSGLALFYVPLLRRYSGLDFFLRRLPMQTQVGKAIETMELYRRRPGLILAALAITFPVHGTVVVSAMLCGMAFHLPLEWWYYFVAVPVIVLSGSIPISPQGAGVMEFFAIVLTRSRGVTIGEAFALTMCIRLVQILWNLTGGFFVMFGGYHAPTEREQATLTDDDAPNKPITEEPAVSP